MARVAPSLRQASHLSGEPAVTRTVAPKAGPTGSRSCRCRTSRRAQQRFPRLQPPVHEHVDPHGKESLGQRAGLRHRQAVGHGQDLRLRRHGEGRVTAAVDERADGVAQGEPRRALAERHDAAGDLEPRQIGSARRRRVGARALHDIRPIHPGGLDSDEHLPGAGHRHGTRLRLQHVGTARGRNRDGRHGVGKGQVRLRKRGIVERPAGFVQSEADLA